MLVLRAFFVKNNFRYYFKTKENDTLFMLI